MLRTTWVFALLFVIAAPHAAGAWGAAGHSVVAEIAQRRLEPAVLEKVNALLGHEHSLASISNWADTIALTRPQTRAWHFVNIPLGASGYDPARDCRDTPSGDCIVAAIARMRATLADATAPAPQRAEALKFLVHLVADIHQPLHCADRNQDAGGSTMVVTFFGTPMSLHLVWDVGLIEKRTYDWGELVKRIEANLAGEDSAALAQGEPADWAWQTHQLAANAYALPEEPHLGQAYFEQNIPIVERQLGIAAIRLVRILNEALR